MKLDVERLYLQHATDADRRLVERTVGGNRGFVSALSEPAVEAAVFGGVTGEQGLAAVSPFLVFAVAVHRTAARLASAVYVEERTGPRQRLPVFDVAPLRELLAEPLTRYF